MKKEFSQQVFEVVKNIPKGGFLSYFEVAKRAGNKRAPRAVGNLMGKNCNKQIPCHRVIKNNSEVGGYKGSTKNSYLKVGLLLKEGAVGVIPTDTLYGVCGNALNKKTVERIYRLRRRNPNKPMIILISSLEDLKKFQIKLNNFQERILEKLWPGKISVVLPCPYKKFFYLHRGVKTLAFRMPKNKELLEILEISGPLVSPSANFEGEEPALTTREAKKYFKNKVFYYNKGKLVSKPSTLIDLTSKKIKILRKGTELKKVLAVLDKN